ncbi:MAG: ABC transporter permease [Clostridia bacterium]|nr:ABC transporter permease [Clostridia bacterium]
MTPLLNWLGTLPGALTQGLIWGIAAIGIYITFKVLDVADLTVDGSIVTGAAVCAFLLSKDVNIWVAILCAFIAGMLSGLVTGFLHTLLGIPVILAGILSQLMLWSANLLILGGSIIALSRFKYADKVLITAESSAQNINVYITIGILLAFCVVIIALLYWFFGTELGMSLRSTGNNLEMSRAQGINTDFTKVLGLALSNGIVALAGSLLAQQQGAANINMGRGAIVIGLAAVIVGEALCAKATANFAVRLIFVVIGAIVYWLVYQTVIFLGLPSELLKMLSALVVAIFLGAPYLKKKYFANNKKKGGAVNA